MNLRRSSDDWVPIFETRMSIRSNRKALLSLRKLRGASSLLPSFSIVRSTLAMSTASFWFNELNISLRLLARSAAAFVVATGLRSSIWIRSILVLILFHQASAIRISPDDANRSLAGSKWFILRLLGALNGSYLTEPAPEDVA